ncbi:hypothetical protein F5884DRAFT_785752 [Xylogone sp. PMI_703]|nr:hypothetical protein F5884DRAFT_785752 [Xylogone sp. PMI_703]
MASYSEATIVSLMTEIYTILLKLRYIETSDIIYPPTDGHVLDEALCASLNLAPAVISLIRKLPCPVDVETARTFDFLLETRTIVYTDRRDLWASRDPDHSGTFDDLIRPDYLLPSDIALTVGRLYGLSLVLDTDSNTIRTVTAHKGPPTDPSETIIERPEDLDHYRNYPAEPADEVLREYINKFKTLEWIPEREAYAFLMEKSMKTSKESLWKNLAGPFREDEWARDHERIWYEVDHRFQPV